MTRAYKRKSYEFDTNIDVNGGNTILFEGVGRDFFTAICEPKLGSKCRLKSNPNDSFDYIEAVDFLHDLDAQMASGNVGAKRMHLLLEYIMENLSKEGHKWVLTKIFGHVDTNALESTMLLHTQNTINRIVKDSREFYRLLHETLITDKDQANEDTRNFLKIAKADLELSVAIDNFRTQTSTDVTQKAKKIKRLTDELDKESTAKDKLELLDLVERVGQYAFDVKFNQSERDNTPEYDKKFTQYIDELGETIIREDEDACK